MSDPVSLRLQRISESDQTLVLLDLSCRRSVSGRVAPSQVEELFHSLYLPAPNRVSNRFLSLEGQGLAARRPGRGDVWAVTPEGRRHIGGLFSELDYHLLESELSSMGSSTIGHTIHPVIPPTLAPPGIVRPVLDYIEKHPFDQNVFAMTRFPSEIADPIASAIEAATDVCSRHGLTLQIASGEAIVDDLWSNVAAHMWASRYGIAFFEDLADEGLNHNMTIEVGGMLVTGRRCALLKDGSIRQMPTDLVGQIYKSVDFNDQDTIITALETWITDDLGL